MTQLKDLLIKRIAELDAIITKTEAAAKIETDHLRVSTVRGRACYYTRRPGSDRAEEQYRSVRELDKVKEVAQFNYEKRLNRAAKHQKAQIQRLLLHYDDQELTNVYSNMSPSRQILLDPLAVDDDTYAKMWQAIPFEAKSMDNPTSLYTENGEMVRSKSEKIIADRYLKLGIPYRYECPLRLKEGRRTVVIHPDFTVLNRKTRQVFYHEHLGKMDDQDYCLTALERIEMYEKNGIFPGINLLITHESKNDPLDMKVFECLAKRFLLS